MRLIAEDLTVYEVEEVVARCKEQSARTGHSQGLKNGFVAATIVLGLLTGLGWMGGVISFQARPVRPTEPGLSGTVPIGAPAPPLGTVPPLPGSAPGGKLQGGSVPSAHDKSQVPSAKPLPKTLPGAPAPDQPEPRKP